MPQITKIASIDDLLKQTVAAPIDSVSGKLDLKIKEINISQSEKLIAAQAQSYGIPHIDLNNFPISPEALSLIDQNESESLGAICFYRTQNDIRIGATNPQNQEIIELITKTQTALPNTKVVLYMISAYSFAKAFKLYDNLPKTREIATGVKITETDLKEFSADSFKNFNDLQNKIANASLTKVINLIIAASLAMRASDIHIEAEEQNIVIRYRIDGILHEVANLSMNDWTKIIARIKLLSSLKLNITNKPQDGRFTIFGQEVIDVRVSTLPTAYGESVVMRLLRSSAAGLSFTDLGVEGIAYENLKKEVERPNGMIITTGPTGSGKTTTLYAVLNKLNDAETKIITLEDPIEYKLKGINQSHVTPGYSFADGLRAILRQDPDVIMVGEIRDLETAETAINAALTGHLVISTIHTNSAAAAIPRFLSMGVKPFLLAPSLNAIIGQRLCRKICSNCKKETKPVEPVIQRVKEILTNLPNKESYQLDLNNLKFYKGAGCETCQGLGYKGRIGIYEVLIMSEEIEKVILSEKISEYEMQNIAVKQGMVTMVQDGILKALKGVTTIDEVFRVVE